MTVAIAIEKINAKFSKEKENYHGKIQKELDNRNITLVGWRRRSIADRFWT